MKILKAIAILLLGLLVAFILGARTTLPTDPNFATGGHAAPGDGFLIVAYLFISLSASIPISIAVALWVLFRKPAAAYIRQAKFTA
jgi:hypothetical protein